MNTENTKAQMRKGILEFCILSLINNREMYVSDLIDELKKGKLDVVEGTLYPLLTRLKNGEFLAYRWEESTSGPYSETKVTTSSTSTSDDSLFAISLLAVLVSLYSLYIATKTRKAARV